MLPRGVPQRLIKSTMSPKPPMSGQLIKRVCLIAVVGAQEAGEVFWCSEPTPSLGPPRGHPKMPRAATAHLAAQLGGSAIGRFRNWKTPGGAILGASWGVSRCILGGILGGIPLNPR